MSHKRGVIESGGRETPGVAELRQHYEMAELMRCEMNRKLDKLVAERDYWDREASRILVELENCGVSSERRNITQPADWWDAFADQAREDGQTLSEWAGDCMRANLPNDVALGLSERPAANRPKKPKGEGR